MAQLRGLAAQVLVVAVPVLLVVIQTAGSQLPSQPPTPLPAP